MSEKFTYSPPELGPVIEEEREPMKNLVELFETVYYSSGAITHKSKFARSDSQPEGKERPMYSLYAEQKCLRI